MAAEILSIASGELDSADVVVSSTLTVGLKGNIDAKARLVIKLKSEAGGYYNDVDELSWQKTAVLIQAPGTYRFTRMAGSTFGVFSA